jgi:hypothetical protein
MEGGSKAIQSARAEADKLGLTLNETSTHQFAQAHEAIVRLESAFAGAKNTLKEAAAATEQFTHRLFDNVLHCEQTLASLNKAQQAYHDNVKKTGQTLTTAYHPALQATFLQQQKNKASLKTLTDTEKNYQKQLEKGNALTKEMRTPQEIYRDQLKEINQLLQANAINHHTYSRAIQQYQKQLLEANGMSKLLEDQKKASTRKN